MDKWAQHSRSTLFYFRRSPHTIIYNSPTIGSNKRLKRNRKRFTHLLLFTEIQK